MSKGKIPDRWIPYYACGNVIEGTRIICFKVPLNKNVQTRVPGITRIWDIPAVLQEIPKLGAVIDLTNTARYYNPREFEAANVMHRKILMPGREIPPESKVREFMNAVDEFLGKDCDSLVGVHCTHGLNRTGYMVCRYMRDRMKMPVLEAIERFEKARGYKMERENYIADLKNIKPPPPDLGKETVIKPIANQNDVMNEDAPKDYYNSRFVNNEHGRSYQHYDNINSSNSYGNYYNRDNGDTYLSWRQRGENSGSNSQHSRGNFHPYGGNRFSRDRTGPDRSSYSYTHDY